MKRATLCLALAVSACAHDQQVRIQTIETKVPIPVASIKASDVPPLPAQLPPRPARASAAADAALAGRCDAIAFVIRAYPLLLLAAGLPPAQAPDYPECRKALDAVKP